MCGIAGAIGAIDRRIADAVRKMNAEQSHRGPDGEGYWPEPLSDGVYPDTKVLLAHKRLAIIDLSNAGHQPMVDPVTGNVIVFNGEIYNYLSLRNELEKLGHKFRTHSDTETLLVAYRHWGDNLVDKLRGIFAFVLWNPSSQRALMARDHLGVKPLYWTAIESGGGRTILFASELRAILATKLTERRIDQTGLQSYLWNGFVYGSGTIVSGIDILPAGSLASMDVRNPTITPRRFWSIPTSSNDLNSGTEELQQVLRESVQLQLVSDVPLGIFLSGGIDSSAVAALAVRAAGNANVRTFTVGFDEQRYDESRYASAVASELGTDHHQIRLTQETFSTQIESALASIDQPTFDAINSYFVSRAVREAGITVALAGTGGDELFGGYRSFRYLPTAAKIGKALSWLPAPLIGKASRAIGIARSKRYPNSVAPQTRWGKIGDALLTRGNLVELYQLSYALFTPDFQRQLTNGRYANDLHYGLPSDRFEAIRNDLLNAPTLHSVSVLELNSFIGERLLRDTDAASMAVGLEARVPLLDHKVVECVSTLPPEIRFHPLGKKQLLRTLALQGLNPAIFDRPKSGFELPLDRWCRDSLRDEMESVFRDKALCESAGLSSDSILALWTAFQNRVPGLYWSRVWALYVLLRWVAMHDVRLA